MVSAIALAAPPNCHPPMSRRPSPRPRDPLDTALASVEIPACDCKLMLMPICIIGLLPGCRYLRKNAKCDCDRRLLPVCLLQEGNGCERRREGKGCECKEMMLPVCIALGCEDRREGHLCECPRWPGQPCPHLAAYAERMRREAGFLALSRLYPDLAGKVDRHTLWARILWSERREVYADRRLPSRGAPLVDRESRVEIMAMRRKWKLSLWHPDDVRYPMDGGAVKRVERNTHNFLRLLQGVSHE